MAYFLYILFSLGISLNEITKEEAQDIIIEYEIEDIKIEEIGLD